MLRPQDILVLLKLALWQGDWTFEQVARQLALSPSAVHRSLDRAALAGLYRPTKRSVDRAALTDFLVHAVRYILPPRWGGEARGIPTAWAAAPLAREISHSGKNPPVWPDAHGKVRGIALEPLHPAVPNAAGHDQQLSESLALVDALRIGSARERNLAEKHLKDMMSNLSKTGA